MINCRRNTNAYVHTIDVPEGMPYLLVILFNEFSIMYVYYPIHNYYDMILQSYIDFLKAGMCIQNRQSMDNCQYFTNIKIRQNSENHVLETKNLAF